MTSKKKVETGLFLLTIAGFLIGIVSIKKDINDIVIIGDWLYTVLLILVFPITLIGVILLIWSVSNYQTTFIDFEKRTAKFSDLPALHQLCKRYFGEGVIDLELMREMYQKNRDIFTMIVQVKTRGLNTVTSIVGFFDIVPINEEASDAIEKDQRNAGLILTSKVLSAIEAPYGIYIGGVFAVSFRSKGAAMAFLKSCVDEFIKKGVKKVYARPTTSIGLKLIENYNFLPLVNSQSKMDIVHLKKIDD